MRRAQFVTSAATLALVRAPDAFGATDSEDAPYAQTILAARPAAYWRLGEKRGPVARDASGNGHDGTFEGTPSFDVPGAIRGDEDGAVRLDGHDDYVEIASGPQFSQSSSGRGLSVEVWMRPDVLTFEGQTVQRYVHWLGKGQAGAFEWGFRFYSLDSPSRPNRISAYIWNAAGGEGAGAYFQDGLTAGRWIHVVACFDPGDRSSATAGVSIYRDGILRGNPHNTHGARYSSYDIAPAAGEAPVRLGTRDLASFFTGALDDVAIYPRVLGQAEVAAHYRTGSA